MPEDAPLRARFASLPNGSQTAVRSTAPRHDNDNQPPDTTGRTKNNMTAVRSPAPRPWHTTVQHNETTSRRPRPLCIIGLMTHIILLVLHNGDGGAEPCSPPTNTTNLTTYQNTTTHHGLANGGAERCSPPTTPTAVTVRSPAPRPRHHPNHTVHAMHDTATVLHQRLGIHPVLNIRHHIHRNARKLGIAANRRSRIDPPHQTCPPSPHATPTPTTTPAAVLPRTTARRPRPDPDCDRNRTHPPDVVAGGSEGRRQTVTERHRQ